MGAPWFDATLAWLPGTILGIAGGIFGTLVALTTRSSKARTRLWPAVRFGYWTIFGYSFVVLFAAFGALETHQPQVVWYSLVIPGAAGTAIYGALYFQFARRVDRLTAFDEETR
jgi:membrane associated rhomboid family serine protease